MFHKYTEGSGTYFAVQVWKVLSGFNLILLHFKVTLKVGHGSYFSAVELHYVFAPHVVVVVPLLVPLFILLWLLLSNRLAPLGTPV